MLSHWKFTLSHGFSTEYRFIFFISFSIVTCSASLDEASEVEEEAAEAREAGTHLPDFTGLSLKLKFEAALLV